MKAKLGQYVSYAYPFVVYLPKTIAYRNPLFGRNTFSLLSLLSFSLLTFFLFLYFLALFLSGLGLCFSHHNDVWQCNLLLLLWTLQCGQMAHWNCVANLNKQKQVLWYQRIEEIISSYHIIIVFQCNVSTIEYDCFMLKICNTTTKQWAFVIVLDPFFCVERLLVLPYLSIRCQFHSIYNAT